MRSTRDRYGVAALGGLLSGYDTGSYPGALLFIRQALALSPTMQGIVVAIALAARQSVPRLPVPSRIVLALVASY